MRTSLITAAALAGATAFASQAQAQYFQQAEPAFYVEGGYSHYMFDDPDIDLGGVQVRGGWEFNEFFSAEADVAVGIADDDVAGVTVDLSYQYGVYARAKLAFNDQFSGHVRVGYSSAEVEIDGFGDENEDGIAYGVGGTWMFNERQGVRADYTRHEFDDAVDNISVSYVYRFGG